jgi:hypothetical protein
MRFVLPLLVVGLALAVAAFAEERPPRDLAVGDKAPDARLNDQGGRAVRLSASWKDGWTVLAFYPKAATPG